MVSVHPSSLLPEALDVVITFRNDSSPIYVAADITDWQPQLMTTNGEAYEHVITVPKSQTKLLYKFRIGENHWLHDTSVTAEPDDFGGFNNRFDIPDISYPESNIAPSECSEATELESVAAVESVADTVSVMSDVDSHFSHDEPEFVDYDDKTRSGSLTPKVSISHFEDVVETDHSTSNLIYGYAAIGIVIAAIALFWRPK